MALTIEDATAYIALNCIDIEDWADADDAKKQRIVNVAQRTLTTRYASYTIPDNAVYEFANVLATVFNDTNRLQQQGVSGFSLQGAASFTFKTESVTGPAADLTKFIPQTALDLISAANGGVKLSRRNVGWTVL
ncbi:hypothetical protein [Paenibacillus xanthanilyticus]|uniref:DUF4054 domain-containing protein n=1 Tax=Paenibacillus xanthanilyticus TaxID=1783531 RepID=A0ABV8KC97_9BACL